MRKPLTLSNYPWCDLLIATCESCKAFKDIFIVNDRKFMFSSDVIEENRLLLLEKVNHSYEPAVYR